MKNGRIVAQLGLVVLVSSVLFAGAGCGPEAPRKSEVNQPVVTFKPQEMADALHAVIAADREVYARLVMQHLAELKSANASDQKKGNGSPSLPAHLLRPASESVQQKGAEFHYVVRSLWAINPKNAPETTTERTGLQYLLDHPDSNYYTEESLGGRRYFTAVYPDRAIVPACVECHNHSPHSPKKDFELGNIMGGIVVRVPLEF